MNWEWAGRNVYKDSASIDANTDECYVNYAAGVVQAKIHLIKDTMAAGYALMSKPAKYRYTITFSFCDISGPADSTITYETSIWDARKTAEKFFDARMEQRLNEVQVVRYLVKAGV